MPSFYAQNGIYRDMFEKQQLEAARQSQTERHFRQRSDFGRCTRMKRLLTYLKPHKWVMTAATLLVLLIIVIELYRPIIIGNSIDDYDQRLP